MNNDQAMDLEPSASVPAPEPAPAQTAAPAKSSTSSAVNKDLRVAAHSHIRGLGLRADGTPEQVAAGLVAQEPAREALGIVRDLIKSSKFAGKGILLAGPSGTGKTALAYALSRELGANVPFVQFVGSQAFSSEVKKSEVLMQAMRRTIALKTKEIIEVYEGEVTELRPEEAEDQLGGYGKKLSCVFVGLKATKGTKELRLDPVIYEAMLKEGVRVGDVIHIDASSGAVKRYGRSDTYATEYDLDAEEYVPIPKGEVHKKREVVRTVTMHDLDVANAEPQGGQDIISMVGQMMKKRETEITQKLRAAVDDAVEEMVKNGSMTVTPGVLFIDEVHILDLECFTFLNRALESEIAPIVIFATNRGVCEIRGTDTNGVDGTMAPHGLPTDLLDRLMIVRTVPYTLAEIEVLLTIRAKAEGVPIAADALRLLAELGVKSSMRYALNQLSQSYILAKAYGHPEVTKDDVTEATILFSDSATSAQILASAQQGTFLQ
ncbi:TIP49-domain-containing protein [Ramicandelaber brevisporus]|nr:TIP49-domain-containing protein [Ramicandelaber brevisporus]